MNFIDKPVFLEISDYENLYSRLEKYYSKNTNISEIYRIGSVKNPGISDLDIMLIVKDGSIMNFKDFPISGKDRLILTHSPFIISEKFVPEIKSISPYFDEFKSTDNIIRKQIASEFLIKFFISLTLQLNMRTIKLRNILLEIKASEEDFEILGMHNRVQDVIEYFIELRNTFFKSGFNKKVFTEKINLFYKLLKQAVSEISEQKMFFFGENNYYRFLRNVRLIRKTDFGLAIRGFIPGKTILARDRKTFNLLNKFYDYKIFLYWNYFEMNPLLEDMNKLQREIFEYHKTHFKEFICPISPLFI
jgi:hypothetical protein